MEVSGSIFKNLNDFISKKHPDKYQDWISKLPKPSVSILKNISNSEWYSVEDSLLRPLEILCGLVFEDSRKTSWEVGRYSAETSLNGIYRVFVALSTPKFILKRAVGIMSTFYNPSEVNIEVNTNNSFLLNCKKLPANDVLIDYRIAGWVECVAEICGCSNIKVDILSSMAFGDDSLRIQATWD